MSTSARRISIVSFALFALMICLGLVNAIPAHSASTSMKVVSSVSASVNGGTSFTQDKYSYNTKRLVTKRINNGYMTDKFKYDISSKIKSYKTYANGSPIGTTTLSYKNGKVSKIVDNFAVTKRSYKNGKLYKEVITYGSGKTERVYSVNSKGKITKMVEKAYADGGSDPYVCKFAYKYNTKGHLKSVVVTDDAGNVTSQSTLKYTYKGGYVTKCIVTDISADDPNINETVYKFSYKKVTVSSKYKSKVKAQQWAMVNRNLNKALPF